jgi:hypothetical protein
MNVLRTSTSRNKPFNNDRMHGKNAVFALLAPPSAAGTLFRMYF